MIRKRTLILTLAFALSGLESSIPRASAQATQPERFIGIEVKAAPYDRSNTPIRVAIPADRFSPEILKALEAGPVAVRLDHMKPDNKSGFPREMIPASIAQAERSKDGSIRISWIADFLHAGKPSFLYLSNDKKLDWHVPWSTHQDASGAFDLKFDDRPVFRYNAAPVSSPNYGPIQIRDAYIHPAYTPSGALITGDFSSSHPHHRGFFLAYERTRTGDLTPDFWNIHVGTGKIHADGLDKPVVGPVTARFSARHRWEAKDKATGKGTVVLRERWDVEAYAMPGAPYWLFDITSTQQAVDRPLELLPYRYGGMAYRGPEPFVKGTLDVLTSEGKHRKDGDQKPARWVDLTGPIADGSDKYAGALIADHPSNPNYPNIARIHTTTLPFFCYVPAHDRPLTIAVDTPMVFRYRVLIHDGHPDAALDERVARDFVEPPVVVVE
jgi:hypothetical protein